jgi:hypothetical protein
MSDLPVLAERTYLSQSAIETIGLIITVDGVDTDPDAQTVHIEIANITTGEAVIVIPDTTLATREAVGRYSYLVDTQVTSNSGLYSVAWLYDLATVDQIDNIYLEIGPASPVYDALTAELKGLIETVWWKFADLFDSPMGGPHLQTYFQAQFSRERVARMMHSALQRINSIQQPVQGYTLDPNGKYYPVDKWGGLLAQATYVEVLKHLVRSYTEQPDAVSVSVARLDRRDYMNRWMDVLRMEQEDLRDMLDAFKIASMSLSSTRVLVDGGAYGRRSISLLRDPTWPRYTLRAY